MAVELNENSTSEDIAKAVDEIASEVEAETAEPEEKSDAQIVSEQAANTEFPEDSIEDTAEESDDSEGEESGDDDPDWRDDAIAEAAAYGFDEGDFDDFQSREEFDRAMKLFHRQMDNEREKLDSEGTQEKPSKEAPKREDDDGKYQVQLDREIYDDEIVDEFTRLRDHYESRLEALEERFVQADNQASEERFDRTVDDLGFAQLFGKTGAETKTEMSRRQELFQHVQVEQEVLSRMGKTNIDFKALVDRSARALFPDEYDKKLLKNHTRRISRQSNGRQGGGATRPSDPPEDPRDAADRLYREMAGV